MHELAIAESIVDTIQERVGDRRVVRVLLTLGRLTCVEPEALRFCFDACALGTPAEGAALEIAEVPVRARCRTCGAAEVELDPRLPLCPCGGADLDLLSGGELLLSAVEVA